MRDSYEEAVQHIAGPRRQSNQAEQLRDQQIQQQYSDQLGVYVQEKAQQMLRLMSGIFEPNLLFRRRSRELSSEWIWREPDTLKE